MVVIESPEDDLDTVCAKVWLLLSPPPGPSENPYTSNQWERHLLDGRLRWTAKSENDGSAAAPDGHRALSTCAQ